MMTMSFLAKLTCVGNESDIEVNVMHKSGNGWKWPVSADNIFYERELGYP